MTRVSLANALIFLLATTVLLSCSEDKKVTALTPELEDQYTQVQELNESIVPLTSYLLTSGLNRTDGVESDDYLFDLEFGKAAVPDHDSVFVIYHALTGWWEGYFSTHTADEARPFYDVHWRDSIQFKSTAGDNQFVPDANTDFVHNIARVDIEHISAEEIPAEFSWRSNVSYDDLTEAAIVVDGSIQLSISTEIDTLGKIIAGTAIVTLNTDNLTIAKPVSVGGTACAISGMVTYTLQENVTSQFVGDQVVFTTWSVEVNVIDQQTYRVKVTAGNISFDEYELTVDCSLGASSVTDVVDQLSRNLFSGLGR